MVELSPGTGVSCCPAASARWRSSPVRKSSPASCAAAIPASSSPAPWPRSRCLIGPTAASSAPISPSRLHSSLTTAKPAFGVSDRSGAPIRACRRFPACCVSCSPDRCPPPEMIIYSQRLSSQVRAAPIGICAAVSPAYSQNRVRPRQGRDLRRPRRPRPPARRGAVPGLSRCPGPRQPGAERARLLSRRSESSASAVRPA